MKILVDKMPEHPWDCPFAERGLGVDYVCRLDFGYLACALKVCPHLKEMEERDE